MKAHAEIRRNAAYRGPWRAAAALLIAVAAANSGCCQANPAPPRKGQVLDHVVAVVNNHAILASDVEQEVRLSVLEPDIGEGDKTPLSRALDELISRALVGEQMGREEERAASPTQAEVDARILELRRELPICVRERCATEKEWSAFLAAHGLSQPAVEQYVRNRVEILRFIEQRFRQGIRVTPQETENYYRKTLVPQYTSGAQAPPLETVAPRIAEILLERQVTALFDAWLESLRQQGDVEVVDPAFENSAARPGKGKDDE